MLWVHMAAPGCGTTEQRIITSNNEDTPAAGLQGCLRYWKPGDDLLSHGETPHYHRRCTVSLLSSGWGQVVPMLYGRQANWLDRFRSYLLTQCLLTTK